MSEGERAFEQAAAKVCKWREAEIGDVNSRAFRAAIVTPPKAHNGRTTLFRCDNVVVIVRRLISRIGKGGEPIPSGGDSLADEGHLTLTEGEGRSAGHVNILLYQLVGPAQPTVSAQE